MKEKKKISPQKKYHNGPEKYTNETFGLSILARRKLELYGGVLYASLVSIILLPCDIPWIVDADAVAGRDLVKVYTCIIYVYIYIYTTHKGDNDTELIEQKPRCAYKPRQRLLV